MLKVTDECWRDGDGLVHMLLETYETVCTRRYRRPDVRICGRHVVPTCFRCIAQADFIRSYYT